jgi:4-hydroxybenzoate polyprenyltransferase
MLAYAQLLRLPNVFTAFADILMAACATGAIMGRMDLVFMLLASSGCLYCSGMVLNDIADRDEDARARPFRPIPSGRVSLRSAWILAVALMIAGMAFAAFTPGVFVAFGLAIAIVAYDFVFKAASLGIINMGVCRALNVLLGLSADFDAVSHPLQLHLMSVISVYIVGVTLFARTEESASHSRSLSIAAAIMMLSLGLAITMPSWRALDTTWIAFPYLVVAFGVVIARKVLPAIRQPNPANVQVAVKHCILGLVLLDAVLASAFVGPAGLLFVLLLLPARIIGKWVYST